MKKMDRVFSLDDTEIARSWDKSRPDRSKEDIVATFEKYAKKKTCKKVEFIEKESIIEYKAYLDDDKTLSIVIGRNYVKENMPYINRLNSSKQARDILNSKRNKIVAGIALASILSVGGVALYKSPIKEKVSQAIDIMIEKDNEKFKEEQHHDEISNLLEQNSKDIRIDNSEEEQAKEQVEKIQEQQEQQLQQEQEEMKRLLEEDFNNRYPEYESGEKNKSY